MITDEQMYWAGLSLVPGVGPKSFLYLVEIFEKFQIKPKFFWNYSQKELQQLSLSDNFIHSFLEFRENWQPEVVKKSWENRGIELCTLFDQNYPELLQHIPDKPPVLFVKGKLPDKFCLPIAVVGTRKITSYGKMVTELFTRELVMQGCEIISGFMYGVDVTAHKTAIQHAGKTIGVLGFGFDHMYPSSQKKFAQEFLEKGGVLITEHLPEVIPIPGNFPARNRIVAGMSKGVLVTEAAAKSGSKITATLATEYGRDVFAVPGSITSPYSEGTKELVNQGAKLVTKVQDILEEYQIAVEHESGDSYLESVLERLETENERKIVNILIHQSMNSDELGREVRMSSSDLLTALSMLEIRGIVLNERGKYLVKV